MKKISKKNKIIILTAIALIIVIIGILIGTNAIKVNILTGKFNSANNNQSNGNLLPEYIKAGITLGGVTGTLEDLDTSDATATPEDILYGKTAYVDGKKITGTYRPLELLQVGDYVDYKPDTTQTIYEPDGIYGLESTSQIERENLSWRVLNKNNDGTVDIISTAPTYSYIYFIGAEGYNNGVYYLNDISEKLYSNNSLNATARSINIEDIEKNMTKAALEDAHSYGSGSVQWGETRSMFNTQYPNIYAQENGSGINTTEVKSDGIGQSDSYYTTPTAESSSEAEGFLGLTITQTFYSKPMEINDYDNSTFYDIIHQEGNQYWLASRCVNASPLCADFGLRAVIESELDGYYDMFNSDGEVVSSFGSGLRPVVTLKPYNVMLGSGDGQEESPYKLIKRN